MATDNTNNNAVQIKYVDKKEASDGNNLTKSQYLDIHTKQISDFLIDGNMNVKQTTLRNESENINVSDCEVEQKQVLTLLNSSESNHESQNESEHVKDNGHVFEEKQVSTHLNSSESNHESQNESEFVKNNGHVIEEKQVSTHLNSSESNHESQNESEFVKNNGHVIEEKQVSTHLNSSESNHESQNESEFVNEDFQINNMESVQTESSVFINRKYHKHSTKKFQLITEDKISEMVHELKRECWICLEKEDDSREMLSPCSCIGSTRYVHKDCFVTLLSSKTNLEELSCSVCKHRYRVEFPKMHIVRIYELMGRANRFICNTITILSVLSILYMLFLGYGLSIIIPFMGKGEFFKYAFGCAKSDFSQLASSAFRLEFGRVLIGAPFIPFILLSGIYQNFKTVVYVVPSITLLHGFDFRNVTFAILPIFYYYYCCLISKLERRLGKIDSSDEPGLVFNDSYIYITKMVVGLMMPYFGIVLGRMLKTLFEGFIYAFEFAECSLKTSTWSWIGCFCYILLSDSLSITYLFAKRYRIQNLTVYE